MPPPLRQLGDRDGFKIGIRITLSSGKDSSTRLYEFDTGGKAFWAQLPAGFPPPAATAPTISVEYFSGISYQAVPTPVTVAFADLPDDARKQTATTATVALITHATKKGQTLPFPIYNFFHGDFGAGLQAIGGPNAGGTADHLLTVLSQLPAPYNTNPHFW